ncbi:hypothetical protein ACFW6R_23445 [Streptomyces albidoflavus]
MDNLTDNDVREILRPLRDGGAISRLYATGEITEETVPALGVLLSTREDAEGSSEETERLGDVITYAVEAGERPPVNGWTGKL